MKKCKYCEASYEGSVCPMCGYDDSEEAAAGAPETAGTPVVQEAPQAAEIPKAAETATFPPAEPQVAPAAPQQGYQQGGYAPPQGYAPPYGYDPGYPPYYGYTETPAPPKKKYTAGSFFLSLAKAAGHVAFYFAVTFAVTFALIGVVSFLIGIMTASGGTGAMPDAETINNLVMSLTTPANIFAGGTLIACLALFFLLLKRNPAAEMGLTPTRWRYILYAAALGVAFQFIVTFTISLIPPVAEYYSKAFEDQYAAMLSAPLWLEVTNVAIFTPFVEEILFRGMIYGSLRKGMPKIAAAIIASVVFGLFHGNIVSIIYATALSLIMIAVYEKTGSLFVTIAMHAALNGSSFIMEFIPSSPVIILAVYVLSILVGVSAFIMLTHPVNKAQSAATE